MKQFIEVFEDKQVKVKSKPVKISGSGNIHRKDLWLNVRDITKMKGHKGTALVAINDWRDPVSVR
jgi:hypothetical protein